MDIDPITGLPKDLLAFEDLTKESQLITVSMIKKKYGKKYTVVEGIGNDSDPKAIAKKLKNKFSCGGTFKDGKIELQGDYRDRMKEFLLTIGFNSENIIVK